MSIPTTPGTVSAAAAPSNPRDAERWARVQARDLSADGTFLYAVTSTGVFCRPSCPSRRPRRDRVRFFESADL
ncbi:MAG: bifunctional transcriptional activator/DNA repair enzyme protein Ada, partial [Acidobacteria bacterium]|nr:bifunctional transcriptional activator/DNA repair enzyme protein Ada [Acidobacteriota bacterium]